MNITALPWGIFAHGGQSRDIYAKWFGFAGHSPDVEGVDLIDGKDALFGTSQRKKESRAFKPVISDLGLRVVMYVSHMDLRTAAIPTAEQDRFKYLVEQAVYFGARYFRTTLGIETPGELFRPDVMENVFRGLDWCLDITEKADLPMLIENFHETTDELVTICEAFSGRRLRMNCEIKPPFRYNMSPETFVGRLIPFAATYHLDNFAYRDGGWDKDRAGRTLERAVALQDGEIDVKAILSIIKGSGFDGWLSIEYGGFVDSFDHIAASASFVRDTWESPQSEPTQHAMARHP